MKLNTLQLPTESFNAEVLNRAFSGPIDLGGNGITFTASNLYNWATGRSAGGVSYADVGDGLERRPGTLIHTAAITGATWTQATLTLTKVGGFAAYNHTHLDRIQVISGTGITGANTQFIIASKVSDDAITLATTLGAGADFGTTGLSDIAASVIGQKKTFDAFLPFPCLDTGALEFDFTFQMSGTANISSTTFTFGGALKSAATTTFTVTTGIDATAWDLSLVTPGMIATTSDGYTGVITTVNDGTNTITVSAWVTAGGAGTPANGSIITIQANYLIKAAAFAAYTWAAGDRVHVNSGTGVVPGWYDVIRKVSDNAIELGDSIGTAAYGAADVNARLYAAETLIIRMYRADEDGKNPTLLLANPTTLTFTDVASVTGSNMMGRLVVRLQPIAPYMGTTDTSSYQIQSRLSYAFLTSTSTAEGEEWESRRAARGQVNLLRPGLYYVTWQKGASSTGLDFRPRAGRVTLIGKRVFG